MKTPVNKRRIAVASLVEFECAKRTAARGARGSATRATMWVIVERLRLQLMHVDACRDNSHNKTFRRSSRRIGICGNLIEGSRWRRCPEPGAPRQANS